jgi:hypothetical protein
MAVEWLEISLIGWSREETPHGTRFFELIGLEADAGFTTYPSDSAFRSARIRFVRVSIEECAPGTERREEFAQRLAQGLAHATAWLNQRDPRAFDRWRADGKIADVFIDGWMNSDQFDLVLPADFLAACGRLGLPIQICTND